MKDAVCPCWLVLSQKAEEKSELQHPILIPNFAVESIDSNCNRNLLAEALIGDKRLVPPQNLYILGDVARLLVPARRHSVICSSHRYGTSPQTVNHTTFVAVELG